MFSVTKVVYSNKKEGEEEATRVSYKTMPWVALLILGSSR